MALNQVAIFLRPPSRCIVFVALLVVACQVSTSSLAGDDAGVDWSMIGNSCHDLDVIISDEEIELVTRGVDPFFLFQLPKLESTSRDWMLQWEYFSPDGVSGLQWRSGAGIHAPQSKSLPSMAKAEGWTTYSINVSDLASESLHQSDGLRVRIDLGGQPNRRLRVRDVVVRPITDRELAAIQSAEAVEQAKRDRAQRFRDYHQRKWPATISSIVRDANQMRMVGKIRFGQAAESLVVIARIPSSLAALDATPVECVGKWEPEMNRDAGTWTLTIPTTSNSPWVAAGTTFQLAKAISDQSDSPLQAMSPVRYCDVTIENNAASRLAPPPKLLAAKGLTCVTSRFTPSQLHDLGLQHASVNILLSGLVSRSAREGWPTMKRAGTTWWINENRLRALDRHIQVINEAGAVAAGILLIRAPADDGKRVDVLPHPESSSAGTYAMPNLTTAESVELYAATLDVLAKRYSGQLDNGRIDHWIVHNEVDYGWQWTNMGFQPMELFMDHYVRSMRLVDSAVRRHNPHGRVFISLTHRWNTKDNLHWKTYAPRSMLNWLLRECQMHGDFPWGVAYHPYPQSLWQAATWNDTKVADDFDTELITVKNLQVLDRFMKLDSSRTESGDVRPVICSEQGFHAAEDDPEQLRTQAAALLYTWEKLRQCSSVLAFDYHRPSDHPREGGLRLGLRGLPSPQHRLGRKKPAWDVFKAIGTVREIELREQYRGVWETELAESDQ